MKTVTFNNGTELETVTGTLKKINNQRFTLTTRDEGWEIDLFHTDIISIKSAK